MYLCYLSACAQASFAARLAKLWSFIAKVGLIICVNIRFDGSLSRQSDRPRLYSWSSVSVILLDTRIMCFSIYLTCLSSICRYNGVIVTSHRRGDKFQPHLECIATVIIRLDCRVHAHHTTKQPNFNSQPRNDAHLF